MHDLKALTPLGAADPRSEHIGPISITEVTEMALASITCRSGKIRAFRAASKTALEITKLPGAGLWVSGSGPYSVIWMGPEQWFVEAPFESHEDIAKILKEGFGEKASITEQTDGWARFDVQGSGVVDQLERLCAAPARRMKTGAATRTTIEHMGCLLICREEGAHFSILAPRSFARALHHALCVAARSVAA